MPKGMPRLRGVAVLSAAVALSCGSRALDVVTSGDAAGSGGSPGSLPPLPSADQLAWQAQELTAFLHFGMDTFTNQEEGNGTANPTLFNPTALDVHQWMATLQSAG